MSSVDRSHRRSVRRSSRVCPAGGTRTGAGGGLPAALNPSHCCLMWWPWRRGWSSAWALPARTRADHHDGSDDGLGGECRGAGHPGCRLPAHRGYRRYRPGRPTDLARGVPARRRATGPSSPPGSPTSGPDPPGRVSPSDSPARRPQPTSGRTPPCFPDTVRATEPIASPAGPSRPATKRRRTRGLTTVELEIAARIHLRLVPDGRAVTSSPRRFGADEHAPLGVYDDATSRPARTTRTHDRPRTPERPDGHNCRRRSPSFQIYT